MKAFFDDWIIPIAVLLIIFVAVIWLLVYLFKIVITKYVNNKKKKDLPKKFQKYDLESYSINIKIIEVNFVKTKDPDKNLAWFALTQLMSRVVLNSFDENGSYKAVLDSLRALFQSLRNKMTDEIGSSKASVVTLMLLNKILRNFLSKWDKRINYDSKGNLIDWSQGRRKELNLKQKQEFLEDYLNLKKEILNNKIIEAYGNLCDMEIQISDITNEQKNIKDIDINSVN